jgi:RND family efflux transporter MFP subunit
MTILNKKVILAAVICLSLSVLFFVSRGGKKSESQDLSASGIDAAPATAVEVTEITLKDITEYIESNGVVHAWQEADISPEVTGKVKSIFAEVGDDLAIGDPIFKLNDELLHLQVEKARSLVTQLEGNYLTSKRDLIRKEKLFKDGVISELDRDLAQAKEKADRGLLAGAKASLKIAERDLRETTIRSPIKGNLAERLVDVGTTVNPQMKVASVVDISKVRIRIGLSEKEIHKIKKGQDVAVSVDAFPGDEYQGTVFTAGMKANETSLTFPVEISLSNNREPSLKPGMVARLKIQTGNHNRVVSIPQDVIFTEGDAAFVFLERDGAAHRINIVPDRTINSHTIVKKGLSPGDLLITVGAQTIAEGEQVVHR